MNDDISYSIKSTALWLLKSSFGHVLLGKQRNTQIPHVNTLGRAVLVMATKQWSLVASVELVPLEFYET